MTLRSRLLAAAALLVICVALSGYLIIRTIENSELHQLDSQLTASVPIAVGVAHQQPVPSAGFPRMSQPDRLSYAYLADISDESRTTIASPQAANGQEPQIPSTSASSITTATPTTVSSVNGSGHWRAVLLDTPDGHQLLVAVFMGPLDATIHELRTAVFAAGAVIAAILLAAGFWIERLGLRPIARMKHTAEAILAGDRKQRVPIPAAGAETAALANALNSMLDQQHAVEDRLRQFVADASHELRTPTSVISGLTQLWRQGDLRDGPSLQDAMRRIGQESSRMKALVEELLLLARLDEGMPLQHEPVDLSALAHDIAEEAAATNPSRHIAAHLEPNVLTTGDGGALRRVIGNLVTNAIIHTPGDSTVTVRLTTQSTGCQLEIQDTGPGMTTAEATHAFDRFWRAETSRTRTGSGLGLPIAQAIVTAHGGNIRLQSTAQQGTTVRVELPAETASERTVEPLTDSHGGPKDDYPTSLDPCPRTTSPWSSVSSS
jgi:two-component system, OmpR family, sensor kinase